MPRPLVVRDIVAAYRPLVERVAADLETVLPSAPAARLAARIEALRAQGLDPRLARRAAALPFLSMVGDAAMLTMDPAVATSTAPPDALGAARLLAALDGALALDELRTRLGAVPARSAWDRMAIAGLADRIGAELRRLAIAALHEGLRADSAASAESEAARFLADRVVGSDRWRALIGELRAVSEPDLAMCVVAVRALGDLLPPHPVRSSARSVTVE
jgi:glutamate dehydrogenase